MDYRMTDTLNYLKNLLAGGEWDSLNFIEFKNNIKPIFFTTAGFMHWARDEIPAQIKDELKKHGQTMIADPKLTSDELVIKYTNLANVLNQGEQHKLYYDLPTHFLNWDTNHLNLNLQNIANEIKSSLKAGGARRERAIALISQGAEQSNAQSRKSSSGSVAEDVVELVLQKAGLKLGTTYGKQWKSLAGSDTDLIIPYAENGKEEDIFAYIAVQSSSNDRVRLSSSELHKGGRRFLCSLNGCPSSSKSTTDIGKELISGYLKEENYYVVIESEKLKALQSAKNKLMKAKLSKKDSDIKMAKERVTWLTSFTYSFDDFAAYAKTLQKTWTTNQTK